LKQKSFLLKYKLDVSLAIRDGRAHVNLSKEACMSYGWRCASSG